MTLFRGLFVGDSNRRPVASLESPTTPISSSSIMEAIGAVSAVDSGVTVTEVTSLGMPAVWRAVTLISGSVAGLPLHPYREEGAQRVPVTSGPAADLLRKPHPDMTPFELWETVLAHVLLWGNAYLRLVRSGIGTIKEVWILHPARVRAGRATDGTKIYSVDGQHVFDDADILHLPGWGYDGVTGVSPIRVARQGVGLALAAEQFGSKLFGSGSLASGVLQTEQRLTPAQADNLQSRLKAKMTGLAKAHEPVVLDSGAVFHQLTIPPEDAQFLETRGFQVAEVARLFGVPPHMLMDTDKSTSWGTGIEQQTIGFVAFTLRPWLIRVEQRLNRILQPEPVYARFSVDGLLRGDSQQRATFYRQLWELGAFSTNEIRALEDMPPVEGGDARWRPLNFGPLQDDPPPPDDACGGRRRPLAPAELRPPAGRPPSA